MSTRREFLAITGLAAGNTLLDRAGSTPLASTFGEGAGHEDLTQYVNVFYVNVFCGTGGHGHCFPGATVPLGAVQLSPDTGFTGWDWCSGYHHDDNVLIGFSHTHLSGTGASDMLDLLLAPRTGDVVLNRGTEADARRNPAGTYWSRFSHDDERATPGYYSVLTQTGAER
jgi:putative alpha-1,2-mannosidase